MAGGISLYKLITSEFRDFLFVNTVPMMRTISHQIENVITVHRLPVDFYAGFQTFSAFLPQQARYEQLARAARRIYVLGLPDVPAPVIPGIEFVPLHPDDALAQEWFLVVNAPYFYSALLTRQLEGTDEASGGRRFEGIWTHDERTVSQAYLMMAQLMGHDYQPIQQRDYRRQNEYVVGISTNLVTRLERTALARARSQRLSTAMTSMAQAVASDRPYADLLDGIVTDLRGHFQARTVTLWQPAEDQEMELVAAAGLPANWRRAAYRRQPITETTLPAAQVLLGHGITSIAHTEQEGAPDPFDPAVRSIVAVPLQARGRLLGALQVTDHRPHAYDDEARAILGALGTQLALALGGVRPDEQGTPPLPARPDELSWAVLDSTLDGVIVLGPDKAIRYVNTAARHLLGLGQEPLGGQPVAALDRTEVAELIAGLDAEAGPHYREVASVRGRRLLLGVAPLHSESAAPAEVSAWVLVLRDLAEALGQGSALAPVATDLMARIEAVSQLVSMLPTLGDLSLPQSQAVIQIDRLTGEMGAMIGQLVVIEQAEAGVGLREPLVLKTLVQEVMAHFTDIALDKSIDLREELPSDLPPLVADRAQVRQAVASLLDNAVKYSPSGATVRLLARAEEGSLTFAVRDTGMGIWLKDMPFLFDRFYRVRSPQVQALPGNGLGLALVKAVAVGHGGHAWAESRVGRGSTFFLKLPLAQPE